MSGALHEDKVIVLSPLLRTDLRPLPPLPPRQLALARPVPPPDSPPEQPRQEKTSDIQTKRSQEKMQFMSFI